jgi:hypothetical protein
MRRFPSRVISLPSNLGQAIEFWPQRIESVIREAREKPNPELLCR